MSSCINTRSTRSRAVRIAAFLLLSAATAFLSACRTVAPDRMHAVVDAAVVPLMQEHAIPGMAVAVIRGDRAEVCCYGVASRDTGRAVDAETLFELGSVSKTFTGLLGAQVHEDGHFAWEDMVSRHAPELAGSAFDHITMEELATYSAGGLPLQWPEEVSDRASMVAYLRQWTPDAPAGAQRRYSNVSIGLFGSVAARSAGVDFTAMMNDTVLPALGLRHTFVEVPAAEMEHYAMGYNERDEPTRMRPGVFGQEAYGMRSSAGDMVQYMRAQLGIMDNGHAPLSSAIAETHRGRYSVGPMTQGIGWELYPYPVRVEELLVGNSTDVSLHPNATLPARAVEGPILFNKTGSTNGFSAYVVVVPTARIGIALLINRSCPTPARVRAAHAILTALAAEAPTAQCGDGEVLAR